MFAVLKLNKVSTDRNNAPEDGEPETVQETFVNVALIRAFYARKDNKPGTRITFNDGGGFAVIEPVDYVLKAAALVAKGKPQPEAPPRETPALEAPSVDDDTAETQH